MKYTIFNLGIKRPRLDDTTMINCTLPNGWVEKDGNILLLVKDFKRDIKVSVGFGI